MFKIKQAFIKNILLLKIANNHPTTKLSATTDTSFSDKC
jgi:hypothetical protein